MNNDKITKRYIIPNFLTILILIINFILCYFNLDNLINSNDTVGNLMGVFGSIILPYIVIDIIIQFIVLILNLINKQSKQSLNIFLLIIEVIYFIFTNFAVIPFMLLNLLFFNKLLAYSVFMIFEFLNVYIIVLMIKNIIKCKEE